MKINILFGQDAVNEFLDNEIQNIEMAEKAALENEGSIAQFEINDLSEIPEFVGSILSAQDGYLSACVIP